jgi:hypothetical protein
MLKLYRGAPMDAEVHKPDDERMGHCIWCKFWNFAETSQYRECRVSSPILVLKDGETGVMWPRTRDEDWCGHFKQRPDILVWSRD